MDWQRIAPDFRADGSLRDIYIEDTSEADWEAVWRLLLSLNPQPVLRIDGEQAPMPASVEMAWHAAKEHSVALAFLNGRMEVILHFFTLDEIELDIDPAHVRGEEDAQLLTVLMRNLGETTGKPVLLTHETSKDRWIARYDPVLKDVTWSRTER